MITSVKRNFNLFLVSFIILFLEIALIRWISTDVRIFAYLSNFVLLACFIGIGLGSYLSERKIHLSLTLFMVAAVIAFIELPLFIKIDGIDYHVFRNIPIFLASFKDVVIHYQRTIANLRLMQLAGMLATLVMFFVILLSLVPLGQILGRIFNNEKAIIKAYSINVLASIFGIWTFNVFSLMYLPPSTWMLAAVMLTAVLMVTMKDVKVLNIVALVVSLAAVGYMFSKDVNINKYGQVVWSPYQKLTVTPIYPWREDVDPFKERSIAGYEMKVNNVGFMNLLNLSDQFRRTQPKYFERTLYTGEAEGAQNRFNFPFIFKQDAKSVLILGAGAGNDAAGALRAGFEKVDCVEIDPGIKKIGLKYHPENPYADPRVNVIVDDARSYIKKSDETYDVLFFGLLDAHSQSSSINNMRMDHYVYTEQSIIEAKRLLKKDGLFVLGFWVPRLWVGQRIVNLVENAFGWEPFVISFAGSRNGLGPVMILSGHDRSVVVDLINKNTPEIKKMIFEKAMRYDLKDVPATTDDWPYLYLQKKAIPSMYLCMIAVLIGLFFLSKSVLLKKGQRIEWHFFFLGAAFLLLEFQNINKTALIFGSTWLVNSINISAILFLILCANLFTAKVEIKSLKTPYILLFASLLVIFAVPLDIFNFLGYWQKSVLASLLLNLPIFFAGIIFISSFKQSDKKNLAYGSNLIGAVAGGLLETLAFVIGIRTLVLVTMGMYFLSFLFLKNRK